MAEHARTHGYAVRPVAKIHKSIEVMRLQVAGGGLGPCCATLVESEVMADAGMSGVMLFTSVVTAPKLERLAALNARTQGLVVVADDPSNVMQLAQVGRQSDRPLGVMVDIHVGGIRTGIADEERAVDLARLVAETDGLEFAGVQGYTTGVNKYDFDARRTLVRERFQPLVRVVERLHEEGLPPRIVSGGSTATHDIDHEVGVLTEVQAGTYVFMDMFYRGVVLRRDDPYPFRQSLSVRATVISNARSGFVVTDAGMKEVDRPPAAEHADILWGAPAGATYSLVGDDMGRIDFARPEDTMAVGDVVELMPPRCYQTAVLYSHYHVVRGDELVDIWPLDVRVSW